MNNTIKEIVEKYEVPGDFTRAQVCDESFTKASELLNITIPLEYADFIRAYGQGGIGGIEIYGIGKNGASIFVSETLKYREYGLSDEYIVVENCDEWIYCIDSTNGKIISWSNGDIMPAYDNFDAYLLDRFSDAAENLE